MPKFVPRVRKQKAKARLGSSGQDAQADSNATEIVPSERESKREQMRDELRSQQPQEKISSKKRKRLDHYIDTKLKKEENLELIKKLAAHKVDTSLLRSAKNLGRGSDTQREKLQRALRETESGINVTKNEQILFEKRPQAPMPLDTESDDVEVDTEVKSVTDTRPAAVNETPGNTASSFGSGLKRPLEAGGSIIKRRKRRRIAPAVVLPAPESDSESESQYDSDMEEDDSASGDSEGEDSEWGGFSDGDTEASGAVLANGGLGGANGHREDEEEEDEDEDEDLADSEADELGNGEDDEDEDDDGDESSGDDDDDEEEAASSKGARSSAFKAWATEQRNAALGFTPSAPATIDEPGHGFKPQIEQPKIPDLNEGPLEGDVAELTRPAVSVLVPRSEEIQEGRLKLPVVQEEQKIMESIHANKVTVIWGSTGSGKTTQVPQMMFESGYGSKIGDSSVNTKDRSKGLIGVTQPRRVAATSVAERVGTEMGAMKNKVGYQVRFDTSVSSSTAIKFMTDGILLREIANDFTLSRYSAIVIDEAHERSVNTDILIGLMSRIVDLRENLSKEKPEEFYPIKLVIMSATLRVEDFTNNDRLFRQGPPPIVKAEGRQFPVTEHFSRRTERDYLEEMFRKISRGHRKLPPGGILVFLTGQSEIVTLAKRLQQAFPSSAGSRVTQTAIVTSAQDAPLEAEDMDEPIAKGSNTMSDDFEEDSDDEIHGLDDEEEKKEFDIEGEEAAETLKVHVLPLYSQLPAKEQMRVFEPAPEGSRSIILATNVAETSLTIPGVRYVFDCGRSKEKHYETSTGVQTFEIGWISKASASQRAGRAGRTGPGHCYRLYSSAVYERDFEEYAVPEILRTPVENVALLVKNVDFPNVANFPFPTPPDRYALSKAEDLLQFLGAVSPLGKITDTGRTLAAYPVSPRFGRMMLLAASHNLLAHTIALVASLAVPELLIPESHLRIGESANITGKDDESDSDVEIDYDQLDNDRMATTAAEQRRKSFGKAQHLLSRWDDRSDAMKLLTAIALCASKPALLAARCEEFFIREKGMREALELRTQLIRIAYSQTPTAADLSSLPILTPEERGKLKFILAAGFVDQVAIRLDLLRDASTAVGRKPRRAIEVAYRSLFPSSEPDPTASPQDQDIQRNVYIHPGSVLARLAVAEMPAFIVYSHLSRATPKTIDGSRIPRTRMHPLSSVGAKQLVALADGTTLLELGKPIGKIESLGRNDVGQERRSVWIGLHLKGKGDVRWPIGSRKEIQVRIRGDWTTEKVVG